MSGRTARARKLVLWIVAAVLVLAAAAGAFVYSGAYDVSATDQHTPPVYWLLRFSMQRAVAVRANERVPELARDDRIENGFRLYHAHCAQCHGAPGVAPNGAALGMTPVPAFLVPVAREWNAARLHWIVKHGIKMTGMPAWKYRMSDDEIWDVVAFLKQKLPYVSAAEYRALWQRLGAPRERGRSMESAAHDTRGSALAGKRAMEQYACVTCHVIPNVTGAAAHVGPPLDGMAGRSYIGGVLVNTRENMVRWIMSPQHASTVTAMPDLRVSEQDARDMAAYLETLTD